MEVNRHLGIFLLIPWDVLICFCSSGSLSLFIIKMLICRRRTSRMIKMAYQGWRCSPRWFMSILVAFEMQGHIAYSDHTHNQLLLVQSTRKCFLPILPPQLYNMSKLGNARIWWIIMAGSSVFYSSSYISQTITCVFLCSHPSFLLEESPLLVTA